MWNGVHQTAYFLALLAASTVAELLIEVEHKEFEPDAHNQVRCRDQIRGVVHIRRMGLYPFTSVYQ